MTSKIQAPTRQFRAAENLQSDYRDAMARIRGDRDLSEHGRQRQIAELYAGAKAKLRDLLDSQQRDLDARRTDLERELFGSRSTPALDSGSHAVSMRDAADRASKAATPTQATELLAQAEQNGDATLARAVARHCMDKSYQVARRKDAEPWEDVFAAFLEPRPALRPVVEELGAIENLQDPGLFSPFSVARPHDLRPDLVNTVALTPSGDAA